MKSRWRGIGQGLVAPQRRPAYAVAVAYTPGGIKGQGSMFAVSGYGNSSAPVETIPAVFVQEGDTWRDCS